MIDFNAIGNYRVISYSEPFLGVQTFNSTSFSATNEQGESAFLSIEYRWGINGSNWSLWTPAITGFSPLILDPAVPFYLEYKVTLVSSEDTSPYYPPGTQINPVVLLDAIDPAFGGASYDARSNSKMPSTLCSRELTNFPVVFRAECTDGFKPYDVNRGVNLYQDLSKVVNTIFGHDVVYYSVQPNGRGKDVVLREYNLFDVVDEKCIKVVVPQNAFPTGEITFDSLDLQYNPDFEIHIDRKYFESFFGKGSQPRKRDIIYFPLINRIYQVDTTYLHRDFNNYPVYFKLKLNKYQIKRNTEFLDPAKETELHDYTVNTQDLFGTETEIQQTDITKPQQYVVTSQRRSEDPTRSYIHKLLPIIEFDLNNNWTIVFNQYYDLDRLFVDDPNTLTPTSPPQKFVDEEKVAVRWKSLPLLEEDSELGYMAWFKMTNYTDRSKLVYRPPNKLPVSSATKVGGEILYSTHPYKHQLGLGNNPLGYVSVSGDVARSGGFKITAIPDEYTFRVKDFSTTAIPGNISTWKVQKSEARSFLDGYRNGEGIKIDLVWTGTDKTGGSSYLQTGSFRVLINSTEFNLPVGANTGSQLGDFIPSLDNWYGIVFNFSNLFRQYSLTVWTLTYDPDNTLMQTSDLAEVYKKTGTTQVLTFDLPSDPETDFDNPLYDTDNNAYQILSSPLLITNIRLFKHMVDEDKQSTVLNQNIVKDASLGVIIDNAKPILRLPRQTKNR